MTTPGRRRVHGVTTQNALVFVLGLGAVVGFSDLGSGFRDAIAHPTDGDVAVLDLATRSMAASSQLRGIASPSLGVESEGRAEEAAGHQAARGLRQEISTGRGTLVCEQSACRYEPPTPPLKWAASRIAPLWIGTAAGGLAGWLAWTGPVGIAAGAALVVGGLVAARHASGLGWKEVAARYGIGAATGALTGSLISTGFTAASTWGMARELAGFFVWPTPITGALVGLIDAYWGEDAQDEVVEQIVQSGAIDADRLSELMRYGEGDFRSRLGLAATSRLRGDVLDLHAALLDGGYIDAAQFTFEAIQSAGPNLRETGAFREEEMP